MIAAYAELARANAPVLTLVLLFGGAGAAVLVPHARVSWALALLAAFAALGVALLGAGAMFGAEPPAFAEAGVALTLEGGAGLMSSLLAALAVLIVLAAAARLDELERATPYALALILCCAGGWTGALFARDWFGALGAAQIGALSAVALIGLGGARDRGALNGALRLWAIAGAGAGAMLLGAGLITRATGGDGVAELDAALIDAPNMATLGFVLVALPLLAAAGAAPLHGWAGATLGRSRDSVALAVGALSVIGAISVLARLSVHAERAPAVAGGVSAVFVALGAVTVAYGAVQSVGATNVRRLVAYAGAMQVGCILIALALGSPAGFAAALLQILAWAAAALALLVGAAAAKDAQFASFNGLVRRAPFASIAVTMGALSFMGAPLTLGFLGRWRLIEASVGAGWWWATGATIVASLAAVFFGGRLIERMYFRRATETAEIDRDGWRWTRAAVALVSIAAIALGIAPEFLLQAVARAAELALGHGS